MLDFPKTGIYILLFLPGFIFVQTKEYHLLREKRPQFEKTLEVILFSAIIWMIALASPIWLLGVSAREEVLQVLNTVLEKDKMKSLLNEILKLKMASAIFFLSVCFWSFIFANLWGIIRKFPRFDSIIKGFTGRDWYPSVAFKFFKENLDRGVEVTVQDDKYLGVLYSAPDNKEDKYIVITKPHLLHESGKIEPLTLVDYVVIKLDDISQIRSYKEEILKEDKGDTENE